MGIIGMVQKILSTEAVRHTITLVTGSVMAQAISFIFYPIITRLFTPDDFGTFSLFLAIAGFIAIVSTMGYHYSIIVPEDDDMATACFRLSLACVAATTLISAILIQFSDTVAALFDNADLAQLIWLIPPYVLACGCWMAMNYMLIRKKRFKQIGTYNVSLCITNSGAKCAFGTGGIAGGLAYGQVIGQAISTIAEAIRMACSGIRLNSYTSIRQAARQYLRFPKYSMTRDAVNYLCANMLILGLSPFASKWDIGIIGLAIAVSTRPINIVIQAMQQSLAQKLSTNIHSKNQISELMRKYLRIASPVVIIGFASLAIIIKPLCVLLFGSEWEMVGYVIILNIPRFAVYMLAHPFDSIPNLTECQNIDFMIEVVKTILSITAIAIGLRFTDVYMTVFMYSMSLTVVAAARGYFYYTAAKRFDKAQGLL